MELNTYGEKNDILQILLIILIGLLCDAFVIAIISTLYIPEVGCGTHNYTQFGLLYRNFFDKYVYNHISLISMITGTICLLFFKVFLFPKILISIESSNNETEISEIIKNVHINKNCILYVFIIFCLLSGLFINGYADIYNLNIQMTYLFVIPLQYLVLYLCWFYKDYRVANDVVILNKYTKKEVVIDLIKYVLTTNPFFIILSLFACFCIVQNKFPFIEIFTVFIILLIILLLLFYLFVIIKLLLKIIKFIVCILKK